MRNQITEHSAKSSNLSYWLGMLGIPSMAASILLHRIGAIESSSLGIAFLVISVLGLVGVFWAIYKLSLFWRGNPVEIKNCVMGLFLCGILLLPVCVTIVGAFQYPPIKDITTDFDHPPSIIIGAIQIEVPNEEQNKLQQEAYPDIQPKLYHLTLNDAYQIALITSDQMGWEIVYDRSKVQVEGVAWFQAMARTSIVGFKDDISVRFQSVPMGVRMDVRSRSRYGTYDFGKNSERVREFFKLFTENLE